MRLLVPIILIITAIAIFWGWTMPIFDDIQSIKDKKANLENILAKAREIKEIKDKLVTDYNSVSQENLNKLNKMIPSNVDSVGLIIEITDTVKKHGLAVKNIEVGSVISVPKEGQDFGKIKISQTVEPMPVQFIVSGTYDSFLSFLGALETNVRLIEVEKVSFVSQGKDFYDFDINAITFWRK